jgi:hypothetical protein
MQPQFIVTIQPSGARFDPPAPLQLPNVDGHPPGAQVEMYSFDHDLEEFVAIGLGTVSADGTVIASNRGVGVIKAGWHCGSQPGGDGCVAGCTVCQIRPGNGSCGCVANPIFTVPGAAARLADTIPEDDIEGDCQVPVCSGPGPGPGHVNDDSDDAPCTRCSNGVAIPREIRSVRALVGGQDEEWAGMENGQVTFGFTAEVDSNCEGLVYRWDFGDGSVVDGGSEISHIYTAPGAYTVTLTVSCQGCPQIQRTDTAETVAMLLKHFTISTVGNPERTDLGPAEIVSLQIEPISVGKVQQQTTLALSGNGTLTPPGGPFRQFFMAPAVAGSAEIIAAAPLLRAPIRVTLRTFAPNHISFSGSFADPWVPAGEAGAAMTMQATLHALDDQGVERVIVDFTNLEVTDEAASAEDEHGYFATHLPPTYASNVLNHWAAVIVNNKVAEPILAELAGPLFQQLPWTQGSFIHRMPWKYRVKQNPANEFQIERVFRRLQMDGSGSPHGAGTVHITQQGACVSRTVNNANLPCSPD